MSLFRLCHLSEFTPYRALLNIIPCFLSFMWHYCTIMCHHFLKQSQNQRLPLANWVTSILHIRRGLYYCKRKVLFGCDVYLLVIVNTEVITHFFSSLFSICDVPWGQPACRQKSTGCVSNLLVLLHYQLDDHLSLGLRWAYHLASTALLWGKLSAETSHLHWGPVC